MLRHTNQQPISARVRFALVLLGLAAAIAAAAVLLFALITPVPALAAEDAATLVDHGHLRRARAMLEPRLAAKPNDVEALYLMAAVHMGFNELDRAQPLAEKAVALDGKSAAAHEQLAFIYGQKAQRSSALSQLGLAKKFRKEAEAAIAIDPRRWESRVSLMLFHLKAPGIAGGSKDKARAQVEETAALDPARGAWMRGRYALETKDTTAALTHLAKAVELLPGDYELRVGLASRLAARNDWAAAEAQAKEARSLDATRSDSYTVLATIYAYASRWSDLDELLAASEAAVPDNLLPSYAAARTLITEKREAPRAERYLRRYLEKPTEGGAPDHAAARWRLGLALEQQGRAPEALAEVEAAVKARPDFKEAKKDLERMRKKA